MISTKPKPKRRYRVVKTSLNPDALEKYLNVLDQGGFNVVSINYPLSTMDQIIVVEVRNEDND